MTLSEILAIEGDNSPEVIKIDHRKTFQVKNINSATTVPSSSKSRAIPAVVHRSTTILSSQTTQTTNSNSVSKLLAKVDSVEKSLSALDSKITSHTESRGYVFRHELEKYKSQNSYGRLDPLTVSENEAQGITFQDKTEGSDVFLCTKSKRKSSVRRSSAGPRSSARRRKSKAGKQNDKESDEKLEFCNFSRNSKNNLNDLQSESSGFQVTRKQAQIPVLKSRHMEMLKRLSSSRQATCSGGNTPLLLRDKSPERIQTSHSESGNIKGRANPKSAPTSLSGSAEEIPPIACSTSPTPRSPIASITTASMAPVTLLNLPVSPRNDSNNNNNNNNYLRDPRTSTHSIASATSSITMSSPLNSLSPFRVKTTTTQITSDCNSAPKTKPLNGPNRRSTPSGRLTGRGGGGGGGGRNWAEVVDSSRRSNVATSYSVTLGRTTWEKHVERVKTPPKTRPLSRSRAATPKRRSTPKKSSISAGEGLLELSHHDLAKSLSRRRRGDFFRATALFCAVSVEDDVDHQLINVGPNKFTQSSLSALSLQARLWPSNFKEERANFLGGLQNISPVFKYKHPVQEHELGRFAVHSQHLELARKVLDSVMNDYGSERAYREAFNGGDEKALTPDELVKSAENFLKSCQGPQGERLMRQLNIHFKRRKPGAHSSISVRGNTLNVPLPVTLCASRAPAVWAHELGTHFLRGVVNEPGRRKALNLHKQHSAILDKGVTNMVPMGGTMGWEEHQKRLEWVREHPWDPRRPKSQSTQEGQDSKPSGPQGWSISQKGLRGPPSPTKQRSSEQGAYPPSPSKQGPTIITLQTSSPQKDQGSPLSPGSRDVSSPTPTDRRASARASDSANTTPLRRSVAGGGVMDEEPLTIPSANVIPQRGRYRKTEEELNPSSAATSARGTSVEKGGELKEGEEGSSGDGTAAAPSSSEVDKENSKGNMNTKGSEEEQQRKAREVDKEREAQFLAERADACSEEGLAVVNQHLYEGDPRMFRPALMYFAAARASLISFSDLFHELQTYVQDPGRRWAICCRVKGGMTDTSQPGSFCRDQVYFAGAVSVLQKRKNLDFNYLHSGKVLIDDSSKDSELVTLVVESQKEFTSPPHLVDLDDYLSRLDQLAKSNFID